MPLSNILADVASDSGFRTATQNQRDRCVSLINDAADEIWKCYDLPNCLGEQIFNVGTQDQQITLPYYVLEVRGIRDYDSEQKMELNDMRPRWQTMGWVHWVGYKWRIVQQEMALGRDLLNVTPLTFTLPFAAPESFSLNLEIRTPHAQRTNETVLFAAGDTSKTSVNLIEEVYSITKSDYTTYDVTIEDQDDNELGIVPNAELKSNYTLINILTKYEVQGLSKLVEVLFKRNLPKFRFDTDRFPCGDTYDKAIYYKTMEIFYGKQGGTESLQMAIAFNAKCSDLMTKLTVNKQEGVKMIMDFGINRWRRLAEKSSNVMYRGMNTF